MSVHISGTFLGKTVDQRSGKNGPFEVTVGHVLDGVHTTRLEFTKDFDPKTLPADGEFCVFDVYVFAWKSANGNVGTDIRAHARNGALEAALASMLTESAKNGS